MILVLPPIVLHWSFQLCPLTLAERCLCNEAACRNLVGGAAAVALDAIIVEMPLSRSSAASMERTRGSGEKSTSEEEEDDDVVEEEELEDLRRCPLLPRGLGGRW